MPRGLNFSIEEDAIIRRLYPTEGAHACAAALPERSLRAIRCRAIQNLHLSIPHEVKSRITKERIVPALQAGLKKKKEAAKPAVAPALDLLLKWGRK